jgi:ATP-dependent DNA helicase RecG
MSNYEDLPLFKWATEQTPSPPLMTVSEIYEKADQSLLPRIKEDRRIERKPAGVHGDNLGDYFSMWSNTPPEGGLIAIGIENDGSISGCMKTSQEHMNNLENAGRVFCPDARYDVKKVVVQLPDETQDYILLIRVHYRRKGAIVRTVKGEAFVRLGDKKKRLTEDEIRELEIDRGQIDFEQEHVEYNYPQDFNVDLIQQYANSFRKSREGRIREDITDEEILELRHLGTLHSGRFVPNVACALAFANDPLRKFPGCKIRFLRFEGEVEGTGERWNPIKDEPIDEGSIPLQIAQAERIIESQLRTFTWLGADNKFHTMPEYPKTAWYEALVNACMHRSYNLKNMNIFIKMFDDRLEIESPGAFPPLVTPENIYVVHQPRNPFLMDAMFYLKFVRAAHEGARRIRDSMAAMELPKPEFSQREKGYPLVRVVLRNSHKQRKVLLDSDAVRVVGEAVFKTLSQDERRAINFAAEHGNISVSDLQRLTQRTWHASKKILEKLKKRGIFEDTRRASLKKDPQARYRLKTPSSQ